MATREQQIQALAKDWAENPRWKGIKRNYSAEDVVNLRGSVQIEHTLAKRGSEKLWKLLNTEPFVNALGALTGNQAMQQVKAGLKAIIAIHDTTLGPALGGCRMWAYDNEEQALRDVLRLSRGMTYKSAAAGLNLGGGKAVIIGNPKADKSETPGWLYPILSLVFLLVGLIAIFAGVLLIATGALVTDLVPAYAIGVFIGFTISQAGMVVHWRRQRDNGWRGRALVRTSGSSRARVPLR